MDGVGLCLFLPRRAHFSCPVPSFVEAVTGLPSETPARDKIEAATALMHRLTAAGAVLPLNLFGAAGGSVSDQPDFLVTREALPYVFSLIGGRNWKSGPGTKASPLTLEIWKQLDGAGAQTAAEIQTALGREVTEAAVLRGLVELWNGLRAIPVYDGETTRWELTQARFADEMTASQKVAQTTALSALVAEYLELAIAASSDQIETFLSPLTSRSRVREVVNGLSATRQLGLVSVAATPLLHVAGTLPEFAEAEPVEAEPPARATFERKPYKRPGRPAREGGSERKPFERGGRSGERRGGFDRGRTGPARERTGSRERTRSPRERTGFGQGESGRFAGRRDGDAPFRPKAAGGERPYRKPEDGERKPFERKPFGKKPFDKSAKPFRARSSDGPRGSSRPLGRERSGGARPSFGGRPGGGKFGPKKSGAGSGGAKPWQDRGAGRPAEGRTERGSGRPAAGAGERPFRSRPEGDRGGERGERRSGKFGREKQFGGPKKFGAGKFGGPKKFGAGKSFGGPKFGARSGSRPEGSGSAGSRSYGSRSAGPRSAGPRSFGPRSGPPRKGSRPSSFSGGFKREAPGEKRPFFRERPAKAADGEPRPRTFRSDAGPSKRTGGWKPKPSGGAFAKGGKPAFKSSGKPGFKSGGKPRFKSGGKPGFKGTGKPSFGKSGGGRPAKPFGKPGKPAFGKSKPGGFKPPFRKRKDEGGKNAE